MFNILRNAVSITIFFILAQTSFADECAIKDDFRVIKESHQWHLLHRGRVVDNISAEQIKDIWGGQPADTACDRQHVGKEFFAFVVGHRHDLILAYGIISDSSGKPRAIQRLQFFPHDESIDVNVTDNQLVLKYGRNRDLNFRLCWDPTGKGTWTRPDSGRVPKPQPCVTDAPANDLFSQRRINLQ